MEERGRVESEERKRRSEIVDFRTTEFVDGRDISNIDGNRASRAAVIQTTPIPLLFYALRYVHRQFAASCGGSESGHLEQRYCSCCD